jgi:hypothetical protein
MKDYIVGKLKDGVFPIACPVCSLDRNREGPGEITFKLAENVGCVEFELDLWINLELAAVSLTVQCPQCLRSFPVDRECHAYVDVISCPLDGCDASWCKHCSQRNPSVLHPCGQGSSRPAPVRHLLRWSRKALSFFGLAESGPAGDTFESIMETNNWKRCPGCQTAISKEVGCHHITCATPGCGMHFCYTCGGAIRRYMTYRIREKYRIQLERNECDCALH